MRAPTLLLILALSVSTLSLSSGCGDGPTQPTSVSPGNTATVGAKEARFVFPAVSQSAWPWNQESTPANAAEYVWAFSVTNGNTSYDVGYYFFKYPGATPASGDLASLFRVGQCSVFEAAAETRTMVRWGAVRCTVEGQQVVVSMDDPQTMQLLFSGRPQRATFRVQRPGQAMVSTDVTVQYQ